LRFHVFKIKPPIRGMASKRLNKQLEALGFKIWWKLGGSPDKHILATIVLVGTILPVGGFHGLNSPWS
jgi:hypothetical protein